MPSPSSADPSAILAIDVGAGTQDILVLDRRTFVENATKLVLPSRTQVVAREIRVATEAGASIHLSGVLMGGGASTEAMKEHLARGYELTANASAARTLHNDLDRVQSLGVTIRPEPKPDQVVIDCGDVDLPRLAEILALAGVSMPRHVAVAVQDHGYLPDAGNNAVRFAYLQRLLDGGGALERMIFTEPPPAMDRMHAVAAICPPGTILMDTGAAAVLGALGDPRIAEAARHQGAVIVNMGNMHTFATAVRGGRLLGLFEHHTDGMSAPVLAALVDRLRTGRLDPRAFMEGFDGHGAAMSPEWERGWEIDFVAITGPNRARARGLDYYEAAPFGDMMLTGSFGLAAATVFVSGRALGTSAATLDDVIGILAPHA